jgi:hypothetical protein
MVSLIMKCASCNRELERDEVATFPEDETLCELCSCQLSLECRTAERDDARARLKVLTDAAEAAIRCAALMLPDDEGKVRDDLRFLVSLLQAGLKERSPGSDPGPSVR